MNERCPMCGAKLRTGETCQDLFAATQALELSEPARFSVHHLTVPCYMLQHNLYAGEGWLHARELLAQFLVGLPPGEARKRLQMTAKGHRHGPSLTRGARLPGVELVNWTRTVADVRLDTPDHYCADVRAWAASIIQDSDELVPRRN